MSEPDVLGIDAGGTKTHLARAGERTPDGTPVVTAERTVLTSTWRTGDLEPDAAALTALVVASFGAEALGLPTALGAHGCDSTAQCTAFESALNHAGLSRVRVLNDAELMPATAPGDSRPAGGIGTVSGSGAVSGIGVGCGIGLVCGTGSIAVARDAAGSLLTSGGWGWVLGDEGSAAGLVREAVRAVLRRFDEGGRPDPLCAAMFAAFGVDDGPELAMALSRRSDAAWWGSHAPAVFAAEEAGSALAAAVIDDGGAALALLVHRLLARMAVPVGAPGRSTAPTPLVVAGGSVILGQQRLRSAFAAALVAQHPEVTARYLERPPVTGALNLAASWADLGVDPVAGHPSAQPTVPAAPPPPHPSPVSRPPQLTSEVRS